MFIARPPDAAEKYKYANPNGFFYAISGLLLLVAFSISSLFFIRKSIFLIPYFLFCLIYILNTGFSGFGALFAKTLDVEAHNKLRDESSFEPTVDIYLPNCGEPLPVLSNTFKAISQLDYKKKTVWVLDDAGREEVRILAELHGFEYISRPDKGHLKKAGNMRNAFKITTGEFILVFDADFTPRSDFLKETIFYFQDEKLGILQTPQYFQVTPEQPPIQSGATYIQEVFHRLIQNFRNEWGSSVCTGSCAIYRRKALEPFGGAYPVERSEDVNTGLSVLRTGWKIKYLPLVLSAGLSPDTLKAFFNQMYRWCGGSLHLITSELFWTQPNVSILGKLSYCLSIFYYLTSGFGCIMFNLPSIVNIWFYPEDFSISNYSLILPGILVCFFVRGLWSENKWSFAVLFTSFAASYSHLTSIIDVITGNVAPWVPTGSSGSGGVKKSINYEKFKLYVTIIPLAVFWLFTIGIVVNQQRITTPIWQLLLPVIWFSMQIVFQQLLLRQIVSEES